MIVYHILDKCGKSLTDCEKRFAGRRARELTVAAGTLIYIQATEPPGAVDNDCWLPTADVPSVSAHANTWYKRFNGEWPELVPKPLPTYAFPSVARNQL